MELQNITLQYDKKTVYQNFSCTFPEKNITCLIGKSGCGKTSLLNIISGTVPFTGKVIKNSDKTSYIFQSPRLIPSFTVEQNIDFVLQSVYKDKKVRKQKIDEILEKVQLQNAKKMYPSQISGGMAQRVTLARAFCYPSELLLMDEPFKELDIGLKKEIVSLFLSLYKNDKKTTIFVTHDIDEAILLADTILYLKDGRIEQSFSLPIPQEERTLSTYSDIKADIYNLL